jgi:hypothetical protein
LLNNALYDCVLPHVHIGHHPNTGQQCINTSFRWWSARSQTSMSCNMSGMILEQKGVKVALCPWHVLLLHGLVQQSLCKELVGDCWNNATIWMVRHACMYLYLSLLIVDVLGQNSWGLV